MVNFQNICLFSSGFATYWDCGKPSYVIDITNFSIEEMENVGQYDYPIPDTILEANKLQL